MSCRTPPRARTSHWGALMLDAIFIVAGIAFFLVLTAYAEACDRL